MTISGDKHKAFSASRRTTPAASSSIAQMFSSQQAGRSKPAAVAPPPPARRPVVQQRPISKLASICGTSSSSFAAPSAAKPPLPAPTNPSSFLTNIQLLENHGFGDLCADDFSDEPLEESGPPKAMPQTFKPQKEPSSHNASYTATPTTHQQPKPMPAYTKPTPLENKRPISSVVSPPPPAVKRRCMPNSWGLSESKTAASSATALSSDKSAPVQKSSFEQIESMIMNNSSNKQAAKVKKGQSISDFAATASTASGGGSDDPETSASELVDPNKAFAPVFLSSEQRDVLEMVVKGGKSVFFTGPAGTGKSVLMRSIIKDLRKKWSREPEKLAVTASTGLAACNIGGITLHSFAGIGLGKDDAEALAKKVRRNAKAKSRWIKTKCLVIDEISMVDGDLFDKLDRVARKIRNINKPWGGIQLVLTGDFFQLPPVPDSQSRAAKFAFEASTWATSIDHTIGLTQVFRQRDPEFAAMLNEMRLGRISDQTVQSFRALSRDLRFNGGPETTDLYPTRNEVDMANMNRLRTLSGDMRRYEALDTGDPVLREKLLSNMMCPKVLDLKVNAQVMLIKNKDDSQLFNGLIGKVVAFRTILEYSLQEAMSHHDADAPISKSDPMIKSLAKNAQELDDRGKYPVVEFPIMGTGQTMQIHVTPEEWKVEQPNGEVLATRSQLPLILAWALSIHKAQGQTLERVRVDLRRIFEKGQAYVALSRATSQAGLQVLGFEKHKVMAHPKVTGFYNQLYSVDKAMKKGHQMSITDTFKTL